MVSFKKKCGRCKKNYVLATNKTGFVVCFQCQEQQMKGDVADPTMRKMFDIPHEFYKDSMFLRDIKIKYLMYGSLSERQVEAFKNTVANFTEQKKERDAIAAAEAKLGVKAETEEVDKKAK